MKTEKENTQWKTHKRPDGYGNKFDTLFQAIGVAKRDNAGKLVVAWPWVLGETYEEIRESLSLVAEADLAIHITGRYIHKEPA